MVDNRVLGVPIEGVGWKIILRRLLEGERLWIVTANPEILLEAKADPDYRKAISSADLRTVDGSGLFFVLNVLRRKRTSPPAPLLRKEKGEDKLVRLTGVELGEHAVQYAWKHRMRVAFFGGEFGEAGMAADWIREAYPDIQIHVEQAGVIKRDGSEDTHSQEAHHRLAMYSPEVLLVALGHPRQERWIARYRKDFPELKLVIGVGGTFNFWAGRIKRAPFWMRSIGLEWLYRLFQEPKRWRRIWNAVVIFPITFLIDRIRPVR